MGRELDVRVAKALGETVCECGDDALAETRIDGQWICARCGRHFSKHRSTDIAAAWELVPLLPYFRLERLGYVWQCQSAHCGDMWDHSIMACGCVVVDAPTETEAICQALLEWKEAE